MKLKGKAFDGRLSVFSNREWNWTFDLNSRNKENCCWKCLNESGSTGRIRKHKRPSKKVQGFPIVYARVQRKNRQNLPAGFEDLENQVNKQRANPKLCENLVFSPTNIIRLRGKLRWNESTNWVPSFKNARIARPTLITHHKASKEAQNKNS